MPNSAADPLPTVSYGRKIPLRLGSNRIQATDIPRILNVKRDGFRNLKDFFPAVGESEG